MGYRIGMKNVIAAAYAYDATATTPTSYSSPVYLGEAMTGTLTPNYATASLYGDDHQVDSASEFTNMNVELGVTKLPAAAHALLFGRTVTGDEVEEKTTDSSAYVGIGFIAKETGGTYSAVIIPKVKFSAGAESFTTKGESVTYSTPTISGVAIGRDEDQQYKISKGGFSTEAAALAYVTAALGIPA